MSPLSALALARKVRARRMAREAPREPRRSQARAGRAPARARVLKLSAARSRRWRGPATIASPPGSARASARRSARRRRAKRRIAPRPRASSSASEAMSSARTGTANSAAAVGVGARTSAAWSISVQSVSWPTAAISGIALRAAARTTHLVVEAHEILERAAAARDDQHVRPRRRPVRRQRIEAVDRRRDLGRGGLSLHAHRPDDDPNREAVGETVQNVANDGAGRRRHDADDFRQERNLALARGVEQPLRGEFPAPRLEQRHQRADAGELERLDHDLVARFAREGRQSAGRDDFEPLLRLDAHPLERAAPNDGVEPRVGVLEAEIGVARGMRPAIAGNLAPDAHVAEPVLDGAFERARQFADGDFGRIGRARVRLGHRRTMPDRTFPSHGRRNAMAARAPRRLK